MWSIETWIGVIRFPSALLTNPNLAKLLTLFLGPAENPAIIFFHHSGYLMERIEVLFQNDRARDLKTRSICFQHEQNQHCLLQLHRDIIFHYYMALSHKDWELPNPRIWLAETDIDRGLDFPI